MAKRRRSQKKAAYLREQQKTSRPTQRLTEAKDALKKGNLTNAVALAEAALKSGNDSNTTKQAKGVAAEALFRQAAEKRPDERLRLLQRAIEHAPEQARLHYHHALAAWRNGDVKTAAAAIECAQVAAVAAPSNPANFGYLQELGNLAVGKQVNGKALSKAEQNTLDLLFVIKKSKKKDAPPDPFTEPLLGDVEIWSLLLQILANESSAPIATYEKARTADRALTTNSVLDYYAGTIAMRQGNKEDAVAEWRKANQYLNSPWLVENLRLFRRERATALAEQGDWQAVVDLYQASLEEVAGDEMDRAFAEIAGHGYFHLGFAAGQQGKWQEAYQHFQAAGKLIKGRLLAQNLALTAERLDEWVEAAEAWREMVRRRPRKRDHPDYLNDQLVAAIWARAALCYQREEIFEEAITCLKNAIKYNEANVEMRVHLVDLYQVEERVDAAENELYRILEIDENHIPSLLRLAAIYKDGYSGDPKPIWQRILAIDPTNEDARLGLVLDYVERAHMLRMGYGGFFGAPAPRRKKQQSVEGLLKEALEQVPDHPILLVELGRYYHEQEQFVESRAHLVRAVELAPRDVMIIDAVLHELLHADGDEEVRTLTPKVRQMQSLRPSFWVHQGERVLECELDEEWARFFWDIAVEESEAKRGEDSQAMILLNIFEEANDADEEELADHYAKIIVKRHPKSGAMECVQAFRLFDQDPEKKAPIRTQLSKAKTNARKANEPAIIERVEEFEAELEYAGMSHLFGGRNPLAELFGNIDEFDLDEEEILDAFRRHFR